MVFPVSTPFYIKFKSFLLVDSIPFQGKLGPIALRILSRAQAFFLTLFHLLHLFPTPVHRHCFHSLIYLLTHPAAFMTCPQHLIKTIHETPCTVSYLYPFSPIFTFHLYPSSITSTTSLLSSFTTSQPTEVACCDLAFQPA